MIHQLIKPKEAAWKGFGLICFLCYAGMLQARDLSADSMRYVDQLNRRAILSQQKKLDTTFFYATKAREIATRLDYTKGKADAWQTLGNYYGLNNNNYLSIRYYMDALQAYKKLNDSIGIGQLYVCISAYYEQSGQHGAALDYAGKAMEIGRQLRNDSVYAMALTHYAGINLADPQKYDSVQWAMATARSTFARLNDGPALLQLDLLEIKDLLRKKELPGAEKKMLALMSVASLQGYNYIGMNACHLMAATSAAMHRADSIQYLSQMVTFSVNGGYRAFMLPYVIWLFDWYTQQGKPDSAAHYSGLLLDILEKRSAIKSDGEMDYISFYTQQQDIHSLQLKSAVQEKRLYQQQLKTKGRIYFAGFLLVLLVLATLTGAYFFRAYRKMKRNAAFLAVKNREMKEKNSLLREHDDFKGKLVSVVAHDFRSPLSNIINIAGFLKEEMLTPEEATGWMKEVERTAGYTLQIFDNILAWISSQSSGFVYTPEACKPAEMIAEVIHYMDNIISARQLQVVVSIADDTAVWANREMLQFVHRNFIHNAIKFSPEKGILYISSRTDNHQVTLSVADEGPGIPEDILPHLFEYSNKRHTGGQQGAGLALIICRDFIYKMNGTVKAGNRPEGGALLSYTLLLVHHQQLQ